MRADRGPQTTVIREPYAVIIEGMTTAGRLLGWFLAAAVAAMTGIAVAADRVADSASLAGQFLVASPKMPDPRFAHTVVYMVSHGEDGAMGLVVNRAYGKGPLKSLLQAFGVEKVKAKETVALHYGGPVEQGRGFILHSADYNGPSTQKLPGNVALSTGIDILNALAAGGGPSRRLILLGYAGWGPGQLEGELARDDWLISPAEERLIFSEDPEQVWDQAFRHAGTPL
jgi:putative transcriptional regulator